MSGRKPGGYMPTRDERLERLNHVTRVEYTEPCIRCGVARGCKHRVAA